MRPGYLNDYGDEFGQLFLGRMLFKKFRKKEKVEPPKRTAADAIAADEARSLSAKQKMDRLFREVKSDVRAGRAIQIDSQGPSGKEILPTAPEPRRRERGIKGFFRRLFRRNRD